MLSYVQSGEVNNYYGYVYENTFASNLTRIIASDFGENLYYDLQGRSSKKLLSVGGKTLLTEEIGYIGAGTYTTTIPYRETFTTVNGTSSIFYSYDSVGNIVKVSNGSNQTEYVYDKINRLIRENNSETGKTVIYNYNSRGDILSKTTYAYTTEATPSGGTTITYGYSDGRLITYGNDALSYDEVGNPVIYRGKTATWKGRQMQSYDVNTYAYDGRGRRIQKNGITYTYDSNDRLIASSDGFEYYYDQTGVFAIKYNGEKYVFQRDMLGNVIAILDNTGAAVVKYTYDAWGNHTISGTEATTIGVLNPIRYRGYFFDTETGLYFLQTRYYDPEVGRFLNMDAYAYADPETVNGLSLYAYCGNNPVMNIDPDGTFIISLLVGLSVAFVVGFTASTVTQGLQYGWENISWGQTIIDGLFAVGSAALAATGIGLAGSAAIGALMGGAQYALSCAFHGEALTWEGALIAVSFGAIAGAISGAGASNGKVLANGMTGRAQTGIKAIITTVNKYGINSSAYKNVMNLYGKAIAVSVQNTINKEFTKSIIKIWASTVVVPFAQWGAISLLQLVK